MKGSRSGLTLTELLTVVSVITILASMMSPILIRAYRESIRRQCMANMREIKTGLELIANNSRGKLPKCYDIKAGTKRPNESSWWYRKVARVMYPRARYKNTDYDHLTVPRASNHNWWRDAAGAGVALERFDPQRTILRCPSSRDFHDQRYNKQRPKASGIDKDRVFDDNYGYSNYGFQYQGNQYGAKCTIYYKHKGEFFEYSRLYHTGNDRNHGGYKPMHPIKGTYVNDPSSEAAFIGALSDVPDAAGTILLMDYVKADIAPAYDVRGDITVDGEKRHYPDGARFRHGSRANVLFVDGRVEGFRDRMFRSEIAKGTAIHWTVKRRP